METTTTTSCDYCYALINSPLTLVQPDDTLGATTAAIGMEQPYQAVLAIMKDKAPRYSSDEGEKSGGGTLYVPVRPFIRLSANEWTAQSLCATV